VSEVVEDDATGYVVQDVREAIEAVAHIGDISRSACRQRVEHLFSVDAMVDGYLEAYRTILGADRVTTAQN